MSVFLKRDNIPEWFDLESYKDLSKLSHYQWLRIIDRRRRLLIAPRYPVRIENFNEFQVPFGLDFIQSIESNPLAIDDGDSHIRENQLVEIEEKGNGDIAELLKGFIEDDTYSVAGMNMDTLDSIKLYARMYFQSGGALEGMSVEAKDIALKDMKAEFIHNQIHPDIEPMVYVGIDLNVRDSEIVKDLKTYLKKARAKYDAPESARENVDTVLGKIMSYQVVPFMDLTIWVNSHCNGKKIADSLMKEIITPNMDWSDKDFRERTKAYKDIALSKSFIMELTVKAAR